MKLEITSLQNPRIKHAVRLRTKRSFRDSQAEFLIEGYREVRRALDNGHPPRTLYYCPEFFLGENEAALIEDCRAAGADLLECIPHCFERIAYRDRPDGLIALAPQLETGLDRLPLSPTPLLLILVAIEKPGNLGTMLRSADAVGVDGVIVCDPSTDIHNPNVVRASVGTLFTVPIAQADSATTRAWLEEKGIQSVATTPDTETLHFQAELTGAIALVLGSEQYGLDDAWLQQADIRVRIPMRGKADSLNVASAATLVLYEALRQRE